MIAALFSLRALRKVGRSDIALRVVDTRMHLPMKECNLASIELRTGN